MKYTFPKKTVLGLLVISMIIPHTLPAQSATALSLQDAAAILISNNNAIRKASVGTGIARTQKRQLNSAWYPSIGIAGGYLHLSNNIYVEADLSTAAENIAGELAGQLPFLEQLIPQLQQIVSGIAGTPLQLPLLKQDIATIDAIAIWPLITGGKRIYASRIGKEIEMTALQMEQLTLNAQMALMFNAYYTLKLSTEAALMQQENLVFMQRLHRNAQRLYQEGFIGNAEYLVAQVALKEAEREYGTATLQKDVTKNALHTILGKRLEWEDLSGNFFYIDTLPHTPTMFSRILEGNAALEILRTQEEILCGQESIAISNYFPSIALFARKNLYSSNIPGNLAPRTIIGAVMEWDIFDGTARENSIREKQLEQKAISITIDQTEQELLTAALALRSRMADALYSINTLQQNMQLANRLLSEREKAFAEGMATPTDIVAARTSLTRARTALNMAKWEYCTSLANLLALSCETEKFIELHNEYGK